MARHIEVQTAIGESRSVGNGAALNGAERAEASDLQKSLHGIECAGLGGGADVDALGRDGERIAFGSYLLARFATNSDGNVSLGAIFCRNGFERRGLNEIGESRRRSALNIHLHIAVGEREGTLSLGDLSRHRDNVVSRTALQLLSNSRMSR